MNDINFVENLILVRNEPHIYAFSTNTIPNYLKIGDTFRPVDVRIEEWNKKISDALGSEIEVRLTKEFTETAVIDDAYFRDYSVHNFLRDSLGKSSIDVTEPDLVDIYSREFFKNVSVEDVKNAIYDIREDYISDSPEKKYTYYKLSEKKPADFHWNHDQHWELRPNQKAVVSNFLAKRDKSELLMYAVMRFGKSFTAMYCALETHAKKVLIVSAKADVVSEWKATVEKPDCFSEYKFLVDSDFINDKNAIQNTIDGGNKVAVFLTLQNLNGKDKDGHNIKNKLTEVFATEYDLIIVDETHFGAWAKNYGAVLKAEEDSETVKAYSRLQDEFNERHSKLTTKQKLHLSGTPYNLLYDKKFDSDNMIATVQFSDILNEKEAWDKAHFEDIENGTTNPATGKTYQEFDNPYFGFPRMLRFAFNPTAEAREKLSALSKTGKWTLTEMFSAKNGKFNHEEDVLKLLKIIDGSDSDEGILSFLDIPKIKEHDVCKHMVFVLPYKSSCDAMMDLLNEHHSEFINLCQYKVLNVAGHNSPAEFSTIEKVKQTIKSCENSEPLKKTITLTVNRMLTGVTVREWDTMIMLKNTHSAQEYDQAVFRIQNQYVIEYEAADGSVMKKDMKPQTILVDFDPMRIFEIQGTSSNIVNAISKRGESFEDALRTELKYFPIITYNGTNLVKVDANNIVEIITQYNSQKSILDEACSINLDMDVLSNEYVASFIKAQSKLGLTNVLTADAHQGQQTDIEDLESEYADVDNAHVNDGGNNISTSSNGDGEENKEDKDLNQKFRMCMANILFYVFLSDSEIESLDDVILSLEECDNGERNIRIFNHLELDAMFIKVLSEQCSTRFALEINNKIKNANLLSNDADLTPEKRASNALNRFNRISDSEVVTPRWVCNDMLNYIGVDKLVNIVENGGRILDIASKTGEFAYSIFELLKDKVSVENLKNSIYSIPTSGITYEFTRRMYEILELNLRNLANIDNIRARDLIEMKTLSGDIDCDRVKRIICQNKSFNTISMHDYINEGDDLMDFDIIIGNPPYQEEAPGTSTSDRPVYHLFMDIAFNLSEKTELIVPGRFLFDAGATPSVWNQQMLNDPHFKVDFYESDSKKIFSDISIPGGIAIIKRDSSENYGPIGQFLQFDELNLIDKKVNNENTISINSIIYSQNKFNLMNLYADYPEMKEQIGSNGKDKRFRQIVMERFPHIFTEESNESSVRTLGKIEGKRTYRFIDKKYVEYEPWLEKYKVFVPFSNGASGTIGEQPARMISKPVIGYPKDGMTQTFIGFGAFDTLQEAENLLKYIKSKFARALLGILKVTQGNKAETWKHVPLQDFTPSSDINWAKSITDIDEDAKKQYGYDINEIDAQLYKKYGLSISDIAFIESKIAPLA